MFAGLFSSVTTYIVIAMLVILVGAGVIIKLDRDDIAALNQQVAAQQVQTKLQTDTINSLDSRLGQITQATNDYNTKVEQIREQTNKLSQTLSKINLQQMAETKPKDTEKMINDYTSKTLNDFSSISKGSNLTTPIQEKK